LTITIAGDNRFGNIHYGNNTPNGPQLIFEGNGSITAADVDFKKSRFTEDNTPGVLGYYSNHYCSAIGGCNTGDPENAYGIVINSGIIYAGSTEAENCTALGGGGNGETSVTINGGTITAIATTTGTAIGGGIGYNSAGGAGDVYINGGNIYAYNFSNVWNIASAAIGGAGSRKANGEKGKVSITGGNVYAVSEQGTAIGGGSSILGIGGKADVTISNNASIVAMSKDARGIKAGSSIGGGTGTDGGGATITISGNPIIRTGSIGGGKTNSTSGYIGSADIRIYGGDIQAQFVMAAGASTPPKFFMNGGTIRNSYTTDSTLQEILLYIDGHIGNKITLEDIAAHASLSVSSVCHIFTDKMKISPRRYIIQKKMALATKLIRSGVPATLAAAQVGYEDYSGFYKIYKKQTGNAPSNEIQ
jgi:AraC-like DNA-binding protein